MIRDKNNIEIRKDKLPAFIIRRSLYVILLNAIILLLFIFWIPFKSVVVVESEVYSTERTYEIIVHKPGVVQLLNLKNGGSVQKNQILGYYEQNTELNPILNTHIYFLGLDYNQALSSPQQVLNQLNQLNTSTENILPDLKLLKESLQKLVLLSSSEKAILEKRKKLFLERNSIENQKDKLFSHQDSINQEDLSTLIASIQKRDSLLYLENVLSKEHIENKNIESIKKRIEIINKQLEQLTFRKSKSDVLTDYLLFENSYYTDLKTTQNNINIHLNNLKSKLNIWNHENTVVAPRSGKLIFNETQQRIAVSAYDTIGLVTPDSLSENGYFIYLNIPKKYIQYLKVGQRVRTEIQEYPSIEFGFLEGEIIEIPKETIKNTYLCKAKLTKGLLTNYNKPIEAKGTSYLGLSKISIENESLYEKLKKIILWKYTDLQK